MFGKWKWRAMEAKQTLAAARLLNVRLEGDLETAESSRCSLAKAASNLTDKLRFAERDRDTARERIKLDEEYKADLFARLETAEAKLALLRADYGRLEELKGITSKALDEWKALEAEAQAELARVRKQQDKAWQAIELVGVAIVDIGVGNENDEFSAVVDDNEPAPFMEDAEPEEQPALSPYEQFAAEVEAAGLTARDCGGGHWQIRWGQRFINVWAKTKKGFRMQADGERVQSGSVKEAIKMARKKTVTD